MRSVQRLLLQLFLIMAVIVAPNDALVAAQSADPTVAVKPTGAPAGAVVTVSGTGMQPGERVNLRWDSATGTVLAYVTATSTGTFSRSVTIPTTVATGTHTIFANGGTSKRTAQTNFVVLGPATVAVNPASAPAGTVVTVSGTGMQPGETVTIRWGSATGTSLGTVTATSTGTFSRTVTIPTVAAGSYAIFATGGTSKRSAQTDFTVEPPAVATLAVTPASAPAGTVVTVSGTGMQPNETVTIRWGSATGTSLGTVTATSTGTYSGQVTIPTVAAGTYAIFANGGTSQRSAQTDFTVEAPAVATVAVKPTGAPAGAVVTVSGTGMQPGERVNLRWDSATGTVLAYVTATSTGTFSRSVTIPTTVATGTHTIFANGGTSKRTAQTSFVVLEPATLAVDPASAPAGTVVTVSGTGMQPGETVTIRWGSATGTVLVSVTATSTGTYSGQVTIPTVAAGSYAIFAKGATSNRSVQTDFTVEPPAVATVAVNPASAPAGTVVTVSGTGMQPNETVTIRWGSATGTSLGSVTATSTGTYSDQVTIPTTAAAGSYAIFAKGATSNRSAQTDFVVEASPSATLAVNPSSAPAGTVVTVSGTGMQPGEIVNIHWESATGTVLVSVTATSTGTFSGQVTIPTAAAGSYAIFANGVTSNRTAQIDFTVEASPPATLNVNPASGPGGTVVTVSGAGMQPGERVNIRWDSATGTLLGNMIATGTGTYSVQVTIPMAAAGTYAIFADGATSQRGAQTNFVVQEPATLAVNPASGPGGTVITVSGTGMQPGETVTIRWGSATGSLLVDVTATSTGTYSGQVTVPTVTAGTYAIFANGATSNRSVQADFIVEEPAPATLAVTPASAPAGTVVTVSGTGMQPGETVNIRWGSATGTLLVAMTATSTGTYSGQVTIPTTAAAGTYAIFANGATSDRTAQTDFTVEAPATVAVTPASAPAGTVVTVSGTGMQPGEIVTIRWGSATGSLLVDVTATSTGSFSGQVTIPTVAAGTYAIFANGATSNRSAQTDFTVEAPATVAVTPASAPAGTVITVSGTGMQPGETVNIRWGSATGTSLANVTATSTGTFSGQVTVPNDPPGTYSVFANGATSNRSAQTDFTVEAPATVAVTPATGPAGTVVTVSGTGMQPGETVNIRWGSATGSLLGTVTATSTGTYSGQVTIPTVAAGTYAIFANGATSNRSAQTDFVVEAPAPATLTVNPASAPVGTVVTVSGTGMQPGETVTIRWQSATGTSLGNVTATSTGTFSRTVTIPTVAAGTYAIFATGGTSNRSAQTDFTVEAPAPATLTVNPSSAPAGTVVTVSGTGMQPGEVVNIRWGSATGSLLGNVTATSTGTYSGQVTIPTVAAGTYAIFANGGTSNRSAQTNFVVQAPTVPTVTVNPSSAPAGTVVTVSGTGMQPGEQVTLRWASADGTSLGTVTATSTGTYSGQVTIPARVANTYRIHAEGVTSKRTAQTTFTIEASAVPTVTVNPSSALAGTAVSVSGAGMQPGETVNIRWGSATGTVLASVTATSTGTYNAQVTVPTVAAGSYVIVVTGATSNRTAQAGFTVQRSTPATLTVNPTTARQGQPITITGSGYGPGETVEIVWVWPNTVAGTITASSTGSISGQVTMNSTGGPLKAVGRTTGATGQASVTWTWWTSTLTTTTTTVSIGQVITITGQGYLPGEPVEIITSRADGTPLELARLVPTSTGTISGQITIPATGSSYMPIDARQRASDAWATLELTITGPTITLSPNTGVPGDIITLTGSGFSPNEVVNVYKHQDTTATLIGSKPAGSDGSVSIPFTFPACATSDECYSVVISANGASSGKTGSTMLWLDRSSEPAVNRTNESTAMPAGTPSVIPTETPAATGTPAVVPTETPAATGTPAAVPAETPAATGTPAVVPTETPAATGTPAVEEPTETPAPVATPTETVVPTEVVLPSPTPEPTPVSTEIPVPTEAPTESPTAEPAQEPSPTPEATSEPVGEPASTPGSEEPPPG